MASSDPLASEQLVPLSHDFFRRSTAEVAADLLGRYLVMALPGEALRVGRLVETEAYVGEHDRASHASRGPTARNAPMYGEAGHAYVYLIYGMYWCLNVVTEEVGQPCAVLLRAADPVTGLDQSASGPGRLCRAFGIDRQWNRADLTTSALRITAGRPVDPSIVQRSARVGVDYAGEWAHQPLRFSMGSSPFVTRGPTALARTKRRARVPTT